MQSFEQGLTSPTKRLGVSLNLDTGYNKAKPKENSPPQTPIAQIRSGRSNNPTANRALRLKTGPRETFLDDITPIDGSMNKENEPGRVPFRDSHDLSLSPRQITRDSLVDHMLLSLDQFSFDRDEDQGGLRHATVDEERLYSSFDNESSYPHPQNFAPRNGRSISHGYSYSSDYENADDSSRYSGQASRGRRSNSSSNFQPGLGRINSLRNDSGIPQGFGSQRGSKAGPPTAVPTRGLHSRSGKGSKASSANSLDLGYQTNNQKWGHGLAGRSSSFDFGSDRPSLNAQQATMARQIKTSASFAPYDYDAAPTPTVPGGPSRPRPASPTMLPQTETLVQEPVGQKLERKRSARSSKSAYKGKHLTGSTSSGRDFGLHDTSRELPSLPAFVKESAAPAPHVGYGKSKETPSPAPQKEKQGFFRRVFGSSRNHPVSSPDPPRSHGSTTSAETGDRPSSKSHHIASQLKTQQTPPSREAPPVPKEHHTLTKKPSSFFRRRKKSASETEPPVPVPAVRPIMMTPEKGLPVAQPLPSPVSSLRQVMNPYIRTPQKSPADPYPQASIDRQMNASPELHPRAVRGFSPEYEPSPNATIRTVKPPPSRDAPTRETLENGTLLNLSPQQSHQSTKTPEKDAQITKDEQEATFLQDSSDNDRDGNSSRSRSISREVDSSASLVPGNGLMSPSSSVARDMALVAEYERKHASKRSTTPTNIETPTPKHKPAPIDTSRSKSSLKPNAVKNPEKEWVMITPTKNPAVTEPESRVWLEPSSSEDEVVTSTLNLATPAADASQRTSGSADTVYQSAMSTALPIVQIDGEEESEDEQKKAPRLMTASEAIKALDELVAKEEAKSPRPEDRERAKQIYDGVESLVTKEKAAAWMGEEDTSRAKTLMAYMELYNFTNLNILAALRVLCSRLILRAESQQVDRILDAFAKRWCECNIDHGFKVTDVVHTITYSILLLNTDLHLADIEQKMTRSQFIKNTMPTIRKSVFEGAPEAFESSRPSVLPGKGSAFDVSRNNENLKPERGSLDGERPSWRSSFKPPARQDFGQNGNSTTGVDGDGPSDDCGPLVKTPFNGTLRAWEAQVEIVLKDFYNSIRTDRLPLFGAPIEKPQPQSSSTLSVFATGVLRRSPSVLSKTPSEVPTQGARGRTADGPRPGTTKWTAKNRSRGRLYPNSGLGSSRTSLDDQSSIWSPSVSSSTWSKYSLGKTHTSMSVDSFGSNFPQGDYQSSIGFANALSQAIIREEHVGSAGSGVTERDELRVAPLLEDESLELAGAPWAKEGILKHKHHLEALDRKAKDRNWNEVFAVIEKGYMSLFSFSAKSMRKSKGRAAGGVVGGGNWQENAESLGSFLLRQTIASALPPPGYSKTRPHVWALSLPTGAVHLFQVGTPDIVKEFVSTANYWSARLSNHPLVGGISNIEYGWSDSIVNNALVSAINETTRPRASSSGHRPSLQSSLRSSLDQGINGSVRSRLPGDRITISDWTPPTQSMRASNLMETDQLSTLRAYVAGIEQELQKHNQLRSPMLLAFTPRHPNAQKAMANWEKKSSYLLREIVKFSTYIDSLQAAETGKQKVYMERAERRRMLEHSSAEEDDGDVTLKAE